MTQFTDLITFAGTVTAHAIVKSENSLVPLLLLPFACNLIYCANPVSDTQECCNPVIILHINTN